MIFGIRYHSTQINSIIQNTAIQTCGLVDFGGEDGDKRSILSFTIPPLKD
jgi:hypothetical protein